jgi:hypothetical protein
MAFIDSLSRSLGLPLRVGYTQSEISLIPLIKIFATDPMFCLADPIHWGFLDAFQFRV